jgi:moderate conductance mechanosensitive channel
VRSSDLATVLSSPVPTPEDGDAPTDTEVVEVPALPGAETVNSLSEAVTRNIDNPILEQIVQRLITPGLQILLILVLAWLVSTVLKRVIARGVARAKDPNTGRGGPLRAKVGRGSDAQRSFSLRRAQRADALGALLTSIVTVVVYVLAVFLVLAEFGLNLAPLVAGAGVIGLAVGFGAQDLVKDFLSGVFMLAEDQYGVGDIVDVGEASGTVEGVTLRTTRIRDVEGTLWHVPNGEIRRVGNASQDWARSLLDIGVAYGTDIDLAIEVLERVAQQMASEADYADTFLAAPDVWGVQDLGADSVDIRLVIKTTPGTQWGISRELRRRIKAAFDVAGIEIPFPQRTTWVRSDDASAAAVVDRDAVERAIAGSGAGDRGAAHAARQDEAVVVEDIEDEHAERASAEPVGDVTAPGGDDPETRRGT